MKTKLTYTAIALLSASSLIYCSGTDTNGDNGNSSTGSGNAGGSKGTGGKNTGQGGAGGGAGGNSGAGGLNFSSGGGDSGGEGGSCVDLVVEGESQLRPADIVFVIDNSGSMSEEISGVEQNINTNFAQVMAASNVDYRIIMVTNHGTGSYDVCISAPLSGTTNCSGPPVNVPGQFYHYSIDVQSTDSLCLLLDSFDGTEADEFNLAPGGWQQWLRPEAIKVFVEITDDRANCSWHGKSFNTMYNNPPNPTDGQNAAVEFDKALLGLSPLHFGTQSKRNYLWYSIVGLKEKPMPLEAWAPTDPVNVQKCSSAVNPGMAYQWLSKGTGALRFPLCSPSGYNVVFQDIANGIEEGTKVNCELAIPEPPNGQQLDLETVTVVYTPMGTGTPIEFTKADSSSVCTAGKFYVENNLIKICPASCTQVEADLNAKLQVKIACGGVPQ